MSMNMPALFPAFAGVNIGRNGSSDDDFGDFVFSSTCSLHAPSTFPFSSAALDDAAADDDWGDFLARSLGSQTFHPQSSSPSSPAFDPFPDAFQRDPSSLKPSLASGTSWEKPMGALPLSIFGEEEEEPEPIQRPGVRRNGLGSSPRSNNSSLNLAPSGQLKDLIKSIYCQSAVGTNGTTACSVAEDDHFDDGNWEFKDAFSSYTGAQRDEGNGTSSGLKMLAFSNENGVSQVVFNRSESSLDGMDHLEIESDDRGPVDVFSAREGFANRLLAHNSSVSETSLHELLPILGNGTISIGTNQSKTKLPENNSNGSIDKTLDDQQELCHPTENIEDIKVEEWNIWDNHDLNVSADANANKPHSTAHSQSANGEEMDHWQSSVYINGDNHYDQFYWEFQNAVGTGETEKIPDYEPGQSFLNVAALYTIVDLYSRLKEESISFIVHHLRAQKVPPAFPESIPQIKKITDEIQEAYGSLQKLMTTENAFTGRNIGDCNQLLNVVRESYFKEFEQEYHLSEILLSAEKNLNSAVKLLEHSSYILQIMSLASREQQLVYINAWSKLAFACAKELQHGAKIWTESRDGNVCKLLLHEGKKYFISLGEVYRVSKILKASVRLYMPWLLCNVAESAEMLTSLEKCNDAWTSAGLQEVLRTMSENKNLDDDSMIKSLLESIKLIDDIDQPTFPDPPFGHGQQVCKFSLLPLGNLHDVSSVDWNGDRYVTKLAIFWANQISPEPPELPLVKVV